MVKKFLILFCFLISINAISQTFPFVVGINKWHHSGGYYEIINNSYQKLDYSYFFDGDTIISNKLYLKMYQRGTDSLFINSIFQNTSTFGGYTACFREDSSKVYFILKNDSIENLYYDLNVEVGDTLNYYYNNNLVVDSISFIYDGFAKRKKYHLNNSIDIYFVEGIGASYGTFSNFSVGHHGGTYLSCFEQGMFNNYFWKWGGTNPPSCPPLDSVYWDYNYDSIYIFECDSFRYDESRLWDSSGLYYDSIINYFGNDTILKIVLNLDSVGSRIDSIVKTKCTSYKYNNMIYDSSGIYFDTIRNDQGCRKIVKLKLTILDSLSSECLSGFQEETILSLKMHPNPAQNKITIVVPSSINVTQSTAKSLSIYNSMGQEIPAFAGMTSTVGNKIQLDVSSYPKGVYYILLQHGEQMLRSKFTVE